MDDADRATELELERVHKRLSSINRDLKARPEDIYCIECGDEIPEDRRNAMPNCTRCVTCQELDERPRRVKRF